jgi:ketosteroid isomerase-like protein
MTARTVTELARAVYAAFSAGDRPAMEALLSDDFRFSSPQDDRIDKAAYFERCWPGAGKLKIEKLDKVFAQGDEAFVRYVAVGEDGVRFQNVELLAARDGKITRVEVYFGWNLRR